MGVSVLAQSVLAQADDAEGAVEDVPWHDNLILDEWRYPFGDWMKQGVLWVDQNLEWALDAFRWPFQKLFDLLVDGLLEWAPWWLVVLAFFVIGSLTRNVKVGLFAGFGLTFCGLLGPEYWAETAKTIGFILVAVILCTLIGIPIGVICGRVDGVWNVVRPMLDAMQVVHSFVYMLPFIFFFGIGEVSATMVTMVFALPPLIRLTNLGIRQVPEDVVEAARAYGAPESRVLFDVQLPLARPAIMTGLNQTLLLSISMLGIAAIMGAGGLGLLLFRAINNQDVALAASAGLAFFLVAVVLDRISQTEEADQGGLFSRIRRAWANTKTVENLLPDDAPTSKLHVEPEVDEGSQSGLTPREMMGFPVALAGAVVAIVSLFLTWASDAAKITSHGRRADTDLAGQSFDGLAASGGNWFGYILLFISLYVLIAAGVRRARPGAGNRWFSADGVTIAGVAALVLTLAYLIAQPHPDAGAHSTGIGVWVAIIGALLMTAGGVSALWSAPYSTKTPLSAQPDTGRVIGGAIAFLVIIGAVFSGWTFDQRSGIGDEIPEEIQAEIDALKAEAEENPSVASANANRVQSLLNQARQSALAVQDGFNDRGFQLGWFSLLIGALALAALIPAAGFVGTGEFNRFRWSALVVGLGAGLMSVAAAIMVSLMRAVEAGFTSGIGLFILLVGGFFYVATSRGLLNIFERSKVYKARSDAPAAETAAEEPEMAGV